MQNLDHSDIPVRLTNYRNSCRKSKEAKCVKCQEDNNYVNGNKSKNIQLYLEIDVISIFCISFMIVLFIL